MEMEWNGMEAFWVCKDELLHSVWKGETAGFPPIFSGFFFFLSFKNKKKKKKEEKRGVKIKKIIH